MYSLVRHDPRDTQVGRYLGLAGFLVECFAADPRNSRSGDRKCRQLKGISTHLTSRKRWKQSVDWSRTMSLEEDSFLLWYYPSMQSHTNRCAICIPHTYSQGAASSRKRRVGDIVELYEWSIQPILTAPNMHII